MKEFYENPLCTRYASDEMKELFSSDRKFSLWRQLWLALATAEKELGLPITDAQLKEMHDNINKINYAVAEAREAEVHHDVMAHIYAFGEQCPTAKPIIHLGATSCYVTDNSELIMAHDAMLLLRSKLVSVIKSLSKQSLLYADLPTLGFTHLQPAQLTTVGKRLTLYIQDLMFDLKNIDNILADYKLRGVKGTTGTQASFLDLFDGDAEKVDKLNARVCELMRIPASFSVSGQTYTRKFDYTLLSALSQIAQSASKFANDLRLLQSKNEMEEPFGKNQIGSSAMAYKRNPMLSERICSLSRFVISLPINAAITEATQWLERTLDDSANRRIVIAQGFLAMDSVLMIMQKIADGLVVNKNVIARHVAENLPFMATENLLMECVKRGGDRQTLHEVIRRNSMEAIKAVKENGTPNDLMERLKRDGAFEAYKGCFDGILDSKKYIGLSERQTKNYLNKEVLPYIFK